jgi:CheY-like chemotaxis protein
MPTIPATRAREVVHVDDNPADLYLTGLAFGEVDSAVVYHPMEDSAASLRYLEGLAAERPLPPPDLFIFDISMPGLDGFELLKRVKGDARLQHVPAVMLTTSDRAGDRQRSAALGASGFQIKPSGYEEMVAMVRGLVASLGA